MREGWGVPLLAGLAGCLYTPVGGAPVARPRTKGPPDTRPIRSPTKPAATSLMWSKSRVMITWWGTGALLVVTVGWRAASVDLVPLLTRVEEVERTQAGRGGGGRIEQGALGGGALARRGCFQAIEPGADPGGSAQPP